MSSGTRENARVIGQGSCNGIVRRMVSLPRSIIGGFSRVMGHGIDLMGIGGRRNQLHPPPNFQPQHPLETFFVGEDQWAFLACFEQQYGSIHPFFFACQFMEALKIAEEDHKFMFMYLHSPDHPFTPQFCRQTLCSEVVVQFLDANFVCWGGIAGRAEGFQMAQTLRPGSFPFCALIAPASGNSIAVLQQMEGPISPAELVEILQRTVEEQGLAFGSARAAKEEEKIRAIRAKQEQEEKLRADRQIREEQDAAYFAALHIDKEKEQLKNFSSNKANHENLKHNPTQNQYGKSKVGVTTGESTQYKETTSRGKDPQVTQILIRFPNGERREQSFLCTDKIQSIYRYINSLGLPGIGNYRLISNFPRRVHGVEQMEMTLKDVGLHSKATLFLEPQ